MKKITFILIISTILLSLFSCKKNDPCKDNICSNGNVCNNGLCECPSNFVKIGNICQNISDVDQFGNTKYINYQRFRCYDTVIISVKNYDTLNIKNTGGGFTDKNNTGSSFTYDLYKTPTGDSIYSYFFIWPGKCLVNGHIGFADLHAKFSKDRKSLSGEVYWYEYVDDIHYNLYDKDSVYFHK